MNYIINSLLDTDLYKFTMQQCAIRQFPNVWVRYVFKSRSILNWTSEMHREFLEQIDNFCTLTFSKEELEYLANLRFMKKDYIDFLKLYRPLKEHFYSEFNNDELTVTIEGPWYQTILWEIPTLSMINEIYYKHVIENSNNSDSIFKQGRDNLENKINNKILNITKEYESFKFSDFGTRRRLSFKWHEEVISTLKNKLSSKNFVGTSNVYLAKKYSLIAVGTNAHEFYQVGQGLSDVRLSESQKYMLQSWINEYRGDLGMALSDTLGTKKFLKDFDLYFAKLYDGLRHDSGDPIEWGKTILAHYEKLRIDPKTKTLLFSDSLDFDIALKIYKEFSSKTNVVFGIGTHITNDFKPLLAPLNIVMKLQNVNGKPVAKLSDDDGKTMCEDEDFLFYLKKIANE